MVRINKNKLIIEIDCSSPLATLADFQKGLLNMIEIANLNSRENNSQTIDEGVRHTSILIKEMLFSFDQMEQINSDFNDKKIIEFNSL